MGINGWAVFLILFFFFIAIAGGGMYMEMQDLQDNNQSSQERIAQLEKALAGKEDELETANERITSLEMENKHLRDTAALGPQCPTPMVQVTPAPSLHIPIPNVGWPPDNPAELENLLYYMVLPVMVVIALALFIIVITVRIRGG